MSGSRFQPPAVRRDGAFSLVELLVVVGMMVLFLGGIGFALRDNGPNLAVQNAQGILASAVSAARAEAQAASARTRLVVDANPASDTFLRSLRIVVETSTENTWRYAGAEIVLPRGAYVVPPSAITGTALQPAAGGSWPGTRLSGLTADSLALEEGTTLGPVQRLNCDFSGRGLPSVAGVKLLVAGATRRDATTLVFDNPQLIRGIALSDYGAPLLLNNATDIDN